MPSDVGGVPCPPRAACAAARSVQTEVPGVHDSEKLTGLLLSVEVAQLQGSHVDGCVLLFAGTVFGGGLKENKRTPAIFRG